MPEEKEYELEKQTKAEVDKKIESGAPIYFEKLDLDDKQKQRFQKEIWDEWDEIKKERNDDQLEQLWDALDNQYEGILEEDKARIFNIDRGVTQVKVDKIVSMAKKAFLESDPKFSVTPRPEFFKQGGLAICQRQSDFLDYKLDMLPINEGEELTLHSGVLKGTGILKITHKIKREDRKRDETYKGNPLPVMDEQTGQPKADPQTGQPLIRNKGLEEFLQNWPDAPKDYPGYIKQLMEGKEISILASYKETTYNDPEFRNVDLKNFYVRKATEGYEGLKTTKLTVECISYSYWDLLKEEKQENFYDIEKITYGYKEGKQSDKIKSFENKNYNILECVYYAKLKEDDTEDIKVVLFFDEESKVNIGAILYPYYLIDCYYVPHHILKKKAGFYQPGIGVRLTGSGIAENAILNFVLEGAWITNTVTPITKDQDVIDQFLEKRFMQGIPIDGDPGKIGFLNQYMKSMDIPGMLALLQYCIQTDDDKSRVSSLMSGRESPIDPTAPAQKTMALLQQSGEGISDFLKTLEPAFNEIGYIILNMYYQMSKEGVKYKPSPERITGENPFAEMQRSDLIARTNIQVMASTFDFDKINLLQQFIAYLQMFRNEPLLAKNPEAIQILLKVITDNWHPLLRNISDKLIPTLEQVKREKILVTLQGIDQYVKAKKEEEKITGVPAQFKAQELVPLVTDLVAMVGTNPDPRVVKEQQKNA